MILSVVGSGLVSPFGLSPRDHAFFFRVQIPSPPATPFVDDEDKPVRVYFCPWIDVRTPIAERLCALASAAIDEAMRAVAELESLRLTSLFLCVAPPRAGLPAAALDHLEAWAMARCRAGTVQRFRGEAGTFTALKQAALELQKNPRQMILLLAVDSHISLEHLIEQRTKRPRNRWIERPPHPSEAAAALLLTSDAEARSLRLPAIGHLERSATAIGAANDENDEPVDGAAMTQALRELGVHTVRFSFGQSIVDALRRHEWLIATARNPAQFGEGWSDESLERLAGSVGAAAGAMNAVYGLAALRHGTVDSDLPRADPFLAWAISRDGTRGIASFRAVVS